MKPSSLNKILAGLLCSGLLVIFLSGCEKHTRHTVITFFFTGVPTLEEMEAQERAAEEKRKQEALKAAQTPEAIDGELNLEQQEIGKIEPSSHKPFADGSCHECHLVTKGMNFSRFSSKETTRFRKGGGMPAVLSAPRQVLCIRCHVQMSADEADLLGHWLHTPAAKGGCSACHDPHQSEYPKLLLQNPVEICRECHSDHANMFMPDSGKPGQCLDCHNAHLGNNRLMLKKDYEEEKRAIE